MQHYQKAHKLLYKNPNFDYLMASFVRVTGTANANFKLSTDAKLINVTISFVFVLSKPCRKPKTKHIGLHKNHFAPLMAGQSKWIYKLIIYMA